MKIHFVYIVLCLTVTFAGCSKSNTAPTVLELPLPLTYTADHTSSPIIADGIANEPAWNEASWTDVFTDIEGSGKDSPYYDTRVKMVWDDTYLYVYAELEEEHIWGDITKRDAVIFHNNDFEIFIKPNEHRPFYAEFEVNALGTLWELFLARPYRRNGPVLNQWDVNDLKVGIDIQGSLNDPRDEDRYWTTEWAIPLKAINDINRGHKFEAGEMWRINFSRVQWQHEFQKGTYQRKRDALDTLLPEHNWVWSPQYAIDMHRPEHWGYLYFTKNDQLVDEVEPDQHTQIVAYQLLFHLYRLQLGWQKDHDTYTADIQDLGGPDYLVNEQPFQASTQLTKLGFEITVSDPSGYTLTLNQNGFILSSP